MISKTITELKAALLQMTQEQYETKATSLTDYKTRKQEALKLKTKGLMQQLTNELKNDPDGQQIAKSIAEMNKITEKLELIEALAEKYSHKKPITIRKIPHEIKEEIENDLEETQKCINNHCYRSAVILCGRVLETALHRKYYETTGVDLLEKAPGTGLGNIIAKLAERGIKLDPGLTNQIHLVNQVRVHSVHKKQEPFAPSEQQTQAILLYTTDILEKLF